MCLVNRKFSGLGELHVVPVAMQALITVSQKCGHAETATKQIVVPLFSSLLVPLLWFSYNPSGVYLPQ